MPSTEHLRYQFRFDPWFARVAAPLGIRPDTAEVLVDDEHLTARFGPWRVVSRLANICDAQVTGPYAWPKVIGPPRLSLADGGLTFGTNAERGTCIRFVDAVHGITPLALPRHGSLTVTVEDAESLAEVLRELTTGPADTVVEAAAELEDELVAATTSQLRERARDLGVRGASSMRKAELVEALRPHAATD